jgi:hypothetical protein
MKIKKLLILIMKIIIKFKMQMEMKIKKKYLLFVKLVTKVIMEKKIYSNYALNV